VALVAQQQLFKGNVVGIALDVFGWAMSWWVMSVVIILPRWGLFTG